LEAHCVGYLPGNFTTDAISVRTDMVGSHRSSKYAKIFHFDGIQEQFYYNKCACNEVDALTNRHVLGTIDGYTIGTQVELLEEYNDQIVEVIGEVRTLSFTETLKNTRTSIRARYLKAYQQIVKDSSYIEDSYARTSCFVKYEKIPIEKKIRRKTK